MHGFHFQTKVPNRFAIFFVFLCVSIVSEVASHITEISSKNIILCFCIPTVLLIIIYMINPEIPKASLALSIVFIILYTISTISFIVSQVKPNNFFKYLLYLAAIEVIINCLYIFPKQLNGNSNIINDAARIDMVASRHPEMKSVSGLTEYISEQSFYHCIGQMSDINTLSYFSSDYSSDVMHRMTYYNLVTGLNNLNYYCGNPLADMMLGVRFHLVDEDCTSPYSIYDQIDNTDGLTLYENPYYISFGFVIPKNISNDVSSINSYDMTNNEYSNPFEYQNYLSKQLGGNDIYKYISSSIYIDPEIFTNDEEEYQTIQFKLDENVYGNIYTCTGADIYYIGTADREHRELVFNYTIQELEDMNYTPIVAVQLDEEIKNLSEILSKDKLTNVTYKDDQISGTLDSKQDGTLYISLPYYDTWEIQIDGKEVEKTRFMGGIGVEITSGSHILSMKYRPAGIYLGIIISGITLIILLVVIIYSKRPRSSDK